MWVVSNVSISWTDSVMSDFGYLGVVQCYSIHHSPHALLCTADSVRYHYCKSSIKIHFKTRMYALSLKILFSILKQSSFLDPHGPKQAHLHWQVLLNPETSYFLELYNSRDMLFCVLFWNSVITSVSWKTRSGNTDNNMW